MMKTFPYPSKDLVDRILSEVGFEDRFTAYRLRERTGAIPLTLYSFEEIFILLNDPYPLVDFQQLEKWIRNVMGDAPLADRIQAIIDRETEDHEKTGQIRALMSERLLGVIKIYQMCIGGTPLK